MRFTLVDGLVTLNAPQDASAMPTEWQADADAMRDIASGDTLAFARVYRAHHPRVFRVAFGVLGDREDARDVAHECFLKLHTQAARWQPRARIDTWLYRVAVHTCLSWRRKLARLVLSSGGTPHDDVRAMVSVPSDADRSPDDRLALRARAAEARALLAKLSARDRAIVTLHVDQELAPQEIAPLVGLTENATRVALHRALTRLRGKATEVVA